MTENIPALIAEAAAWRAEDANDPNTEVVSARVTRLIVRLADALESLSASPGDDEREALANWLGQYRARVTDHPIWVADWEAVDAFEAANILRYRMTGLSIAADPNLEENTSRARQAVAALRRLSPLTREALARALYAEYRARIPGTLTWENDSKADEFRASAARLLPLLSRFALPELAEVEWAVRWTGTEGEPVTDLGADESDVRALVRQQEGFAEAVKRAVGPWVPVEKGAEQ